MNTIYRCFLLFLFFISTMIALSQEWRWRNKDWGEIEPRLLQRTDYLYSLFDDEADFRKSEFASIADFSLAKFNSTAYFWEAKFNSTADFSGAKFDKKVYFDNVILPKYFNFSNVREIAIEIDLTSTVVNPDYDTCYIHLTGSSIDKIRFRYSRFKLWFPEEDSKGYELKANVYEELLKKQKDEGFTQSYEILDKEYREFQYTDTESDYWWLWGHTLNWIDKNWWGYGYDKERIIRNVILIYLILSLINAFILKHLTTKVYTNQKIERLWNFESAGNWPIKSFNRLSYSAFYTAVIFFGLKFDMEKLNYEDNLKGWKRFNLVYFFFIYLGGFVCLAYLANYVITI